MANQQAQELVHRIQDLLSSSNTASNAKESRRQACELSYRLFRELEEPDDLAIRTLHQPTDTAVLRLALDLDIFNQLLQAEGQATSQTLAKRSGAEPALMFRILRFLAAHGHIEEVDVDTFKANKSTKAFVTPKITAGLEYCTKIAGPGWTALPAFLKSKQYQTPTDPLDSPLQYAFNTKKHLFDILVEQNAMSAFQTFMSNYKFDPAELSDTFPIGERVIEGFDSSQADPILFVDVGGGQGREIRKLTEKFPGAKSRKILQDLPHVVRDVESTIESMPYDFFTPQPIKGILSEFYSHQFDDRVFHDWPDSHCRKILANTASAMKPGYSKMLIHDVMLPDKGASAFSTEADIVMMVLLSAMERSESQWRTLLESAGLRIVKIWPGTPDGVIEAELA